MLTPLASADPGDPPQSIYNLNAKLIDQSGAVQGLDMHRGHPVLVTMFYGQLPGSLPAADRHAALLRTLVDASRARARPGRPDLDRPGARHDDTLRTLATTRRIDLSRWTLAHTDEASVRKIAAVFNIQYRRLPDGNYNHASVISLLTPQGEIAAQSTVLGKADDRLAASLRGL